MLFRSSFFGFFLEWRQGGELDRLKRRVFEGAQTTHNVLLLCCVLSAPLAAQGADYSGTLVASGNALSFEFDTSNIGGGPPPGWGTHCAVISIGAIHGMSEWYRRLALPSTTGFVTDLDFLLASTSMTDGTAISIAVAKAHGNALFSAPNVWRLYFSRVGGDYRFQFSIDQGEDEVVWEHPIPEGQLHGRAYRHHIEYDIKNQQIAWMVDGQLVNSTVMVPGNPQNIAFQVLGSSGSSTGRNTVFLMDRVGWRSIK